MSYESLMVPLDGSAFARQALPVAEHLARRTGARLELVCVHTGLPPGPSGRVPETLARADREVKASEREALEEEAERLRDAGLDVGLAVEQGRVVETLCAHADERADLVVMATHGRGRFSRFWLGSTADGMVRRCRRPVLLVRPRKDAPPVPDGDLEHVLVPLDGSRVAESALEPAADLARAVGGRITLLHVVVPVMNPGFTMADFPEGVDQALVEPMESDAEQYVTGMAEEWAGDDVPVEPLVTRHPDAAGAILEVCEEAEADLVAMATHGRGGLRRLLLGSVADKVIRAGDRPVLVVRPEAE